MFQNKRKLTQSKQTRWRVQTANFQFTSLKNLMYWFIQFIQVVAITLLQIIFNQVKTCILNILPTSYAPIASMHQLILSWCNSQPWFLLLQVDQVCNVFVIERVDPVTKDIFKATSWNKFAFYGIFFEQFIFLCLNGFCFL